MAGITAMIMMNNARNLTQHWVRLWIYLSCIRTLTEMSIYFLFITTLGNVFTTYALEKCIYHYINKQKTVVLLHLCFGAFMCVLVQLYIWICVYTNPLIYTQSNKHNFIKPNLTARLSSVPICKVYWRNKQKKIMCIIWRKKVLFFIIKEILKDRASQFQSKLGLFLTQAAKM